MSHGEDGREQISWVSWKTICSPKKHGGLRVMEISIFSVTLLAKWKWYLFHNRGSYGKGFLGFSMLPRPQTNVGSVLDTLDISIPGTVLCASTYAS